MNWDKKFANNQANENISQKIATIKITHQADLIDKHFNQFLCPKMVNTAELRDQVFKIRHAVYCQELGFEPLTENGKEQDSFDQHSEFAMIRHKASNLFTSCVRVVTAAGAGQLLPIEKNCLNAIKNNEFHPHNFPRESIAEISRLAVKSDFRRRRTDEFKGAALAMIGKTSFSEAELRCFPFIAIGLYMSAAAIAINSDIKHAYVLMEPKLARSMKFIGIQFVQIGEPIEYHGLRAPYYINPQLFLKKLSPAFSHLYESIKLKLFTNHP